MKNVSVEPLVFLPGMMCDERLFAPQIAAFQTDRNVIVMDISSEQSMASLARKVLKNAPERFALAGLSMGGILAMEVYRQAPHRISRLALMDTNPRAEIDEVKAGRQIHLDRVANRELLSVMQEVMIPKYLHRDHPNHYIEAICLHMAKSLGDAAFVNQSLALRDRPDQQETLKHVDVPTLILMGEDDQLCPKDRHDAIKTLIPHADYVVIKHAGHLPTLEQPEATTRALAAWLNS
ncbi:alpha/beta hydrolase [Enterovibrio norvegicus]|uniref:alpha/beta fold hydrolase n=1 Tax=Enterovibrio norvegicus TaxID=188144 RepID=UPI00031C5596|nr:alpha/beta fold hydrolase [Enterovibrio norvegicus]MCC4796852.1 alpha/beta hydrolase [Enterovibrio norvegicus]OEE65098.1 alpha/beta hydrolase [Enterovibrio norvegicus]PMI37577.1 alpha/beta hydrolase [Enterovibrio norvegicus]PMN51389.1 alpha/beta hydrolase [Enterovibrio norvegicus]